MDTGWTLGRGWGGMSAYIEIRYARRLGIRENTTGPNPAQNCLAKWDAELVPQLTLQRPLDWLGIADSFHWR